MSALEEKEEKMQNMRTGSLLLLKLRSERTVCRRTTEESCFVSTDDPAQATIFSESKQQDLLRLIIQGCFLCMSHSMRRDGRWTAAVQQIQSTATKNL